jgi:hypothetical protein
MNYYHLLILINILYKSLSFKCGHNTIKKPEIKMVNLTNEENIKSRGLSSSHSINIYIDYEILQSQKNKRKIFNFEYSNLESALNSAANYFPKLLSIDESSPIILYSDKFKDAPYIE